MIRKVVDEKPLVGLPALQLEASGLAPRAVASEHRCDASCATRQDSSDTFR